MCQLRMIKFKLRLNKNQKQRKKYPEKGLGQFPKAWDLEILFHSFSSFFFFKTYSLNSLRKDKEKKKESHFENSLVKFRQRIATRNSKIWSNRQDKRSDSCTLRTKEGADHYFNEMQDINKQKARKLCRKLSQMSE